MQPGVLASSLVVRTVHDWTFEIGEWRFGIDEGYVSGGHLNDPQPWTSIHVGPKSFPTTLSANEVLGVSGLLITVVILALLTVKFGRRQELQS